MKKEINEVNKIILEIFIGDKNFPLSHEKQELGIINQSIVIKSETSDKFTEYLLKRYKHKVIFPRKIKGEYISIHPELLPDELYNLYSELTENRTNPITGNTYRKLIEVIKSFPFISKEDEELILFLIISGNKLPMKYKEKLVIDLERLFPEFINKIAFHKSVENWIESFKPEIGKLDLALKGLFFIITEVIDEEYDIETEETGEIFIEDKVLKKINKIWEKESLRVLGYQPFIYPKSEMKIN